MRAPLRKPCRWVLVIVLVMLSQTGDAYRPDPITGHQVVIDR